MDFLTLQNDVLAYGFSASMYRDRVKRWLNEAQKELFREGDFRAGQASSTIAITGGQNVYALPADFNHLINIKKASDGTLINQVSITDFDTLDAAGRGFIATDEYVAVYGSDIRPSDSLITQAGSLTIRYWKTPADMVNNTDVPAIPTDYHGILIYKAAAEAYSAEGDVQMHDHYLQKWNNAKVQMIGELQTDTDTESKQIKGAFN